jgi:hypothetical protein
MKKFLPVSIMAGYLLLPNMSAEVEIYTQPKKEIGMELPPGDVPFYIWDYVIPEEKRKIAASAAIDENIGAVRDSDMWTHIGQTEWESLYPPARAAAAKNMVRHWSRHYRVGEKAGIPIHAFDEVFTAMIISESELEHFASEGGDLGLSMVSAWTRPRLRKMYRDGRADFNFEDADYLNSSNGIRAGIFWFNYLLEEEIASRPARNSREALKYLETTVGAYNDGTRNAEEMSPKSMAYRKKVGRIMRNCRNSYETTCLALSNSPYHRSE